MLKCFSNYWFSPKIHYINDDSTHQILRDPIPDHLDEIIFLSALFLCTEHILHTANSEGLLQTNFAEQ